MAFLLLVQRPVSMKIADSRCVMTKKVDEKKNPYSAETFKSYNPNGTYIDRKIARGELWPAWIERNSIRLWELIPIKPENNIRIMTYNVFSDRDYKGESSSDRLFNAVNNDGKLQPDIILIQEGKTSR